MMKEIRDVAKRRRINHVSSKEKDIIALRSTLAENHSYSLTLAGQLQDLQINPPQAVMRARLKSPGLTEISISTGSALGFGLTQWNFIVGGLGICSEDKDDFHSPVGLRISSPISHALVNDMGFVHDDFWLGLEHEPSLRDIVTQAAKFLNAPIDGDASRREIQRWVEAQTFTARKLQAIQSFKHISKFPSVCNERGAEWSTTWLHTDFIQAAKLCKANPMLWRDFVVEVSPGIFTFDFISDEFCDLLIREMDEFESSDQPKRRPNTMNKYGVILAEMGMHGLVTTLVDEWLAPMAAVLYPQEPVAVALDHHHSFFVQYDPHGGDLGLDMHHDR